MLRFSYSSNVPSTLKDPIITHWFSYYLDGSLYLDVFLIRFLSIDIAWGTIFSTRTRIGNSSKTGCNICLIRWPISLHPQRLIHVCQWNNKSKICVLFILQNIPLLVRSVPRYDPWTHKCGLHVESWWGLNHAHFKHCSTAGNMSLRLISCINSFVNKVLSIVRTDLRFFSKKVCRLSSRIKCMNGIKESVPCVPSNSSVAPNVWLLWSSNVSRTGTWQIHHLFSNFVHGCSHSTTSSPLNSDPTIHWGGCATGTWMSSHHQGFGPGWIPGPGLETFCATTVPHCFWMHSSSLDCLPIYSTHMMVDRMAPSHSKAQ